MNERKAIKKPYSASLRKEALRDAYHFIVYTFQEKKHWLPEKEIYSLYEKTNSIIIDPKTFNFLYSTIQEECRNIMEDERE